MNLSAECKACGFTLNELSDTSKIPLSTLHDWKKSKPMVIHLMIKGMETWVNNPMDFDFYGDHDSSNPELEEIRTSSNIKRG